MKLILASGSPRRASILKSLGIAFEVVKPEVREVSYPDDPERTVRENALAKGAAIGGPTLSADTIVWYDHRIYGKPRDLDEAKAFLRELSGKIHVVFTGVAYQGEVKVVRSEVKFRELSASMIDDYVARVKPTDRAGAYDIDESGDLIVERYTGSYENIMGLPVEPLREWGLVPGSETPAALVARGVVRGYGREPVLRGLDLELKSGALVVLMGPSGCGKSTFLHLAAGLLAAEAGSIVIGGTDVTRLGDAAAAKFRRRHLGVVFQDFNLLNERTVRENILLPLKLDGADLQAAAPRLMRLATALKIAGLLDRRPEELSGGERQRVAVARALIAEPAVVLADEPTGNLDARSARELCTLLQALNRTEQSAILLVTHDPVVAAIAEAVHFLKDGKIAVSLAPHGDPAVVSQRYLETYR